MSFELLSEDEIIEKVFLLPIMNDPFGNYDNKINIIKHYATNHNCQVIKCLNKRILDSHNKEMMSLSDFDYFVIDEFKSDPMSALNYKLIKYKFKTNINLKLNSIDLNIDLYEKLIHHFNKLTNHTGSQTDNNL
jgi:hypothetical protein